MNAARWVGCIDERAGLEGGERHLPSHVLGVKVHVLLPGLVQLVFHARVQHVVDTPGLYGFYFLFSPLHGFHVRVDGGLGSVQPLQDGQQTPVDIVRYLYDLVRRFILFFPAFGGGM